MTSPALENHAGWRQPASKPERSEISPATAGELAENIHDHRANRDPLNGQRSASYRQIISTG
jgi:hypothetical protein